MILLRAQINSQTQNYQIFNTFDYEATQKIVMLSTLNVGKSVNRQSMPLLPINFKPVNLKTLPKQQNKGVGVYE